MLDESGFTRMSSNPLRVIGRTIAGTGTMKGRLLAETPPKDVRSWQSLRIIGWIMIIIGLLLLLREVANYLQTETIDYGLFLLGVVLGLLGAKLPTLNRFSSSFIWIDIQGEAFPSQLRQHEAEVPGTLPIVADLRIGVKGGSAISRNDVTRRKLLRVFDSAQSREGFRRVVDTVTERVLPRVGVKAEIGIVDGEPPPPPPGD